MEKEITEIRTFGDTRRLILQTIMQIRDGGLDVSQGMAIAANLRELNNNIQCEINAAKLQLVAEERGHDFGKIVAMGRQVINGEPAKLESKE